MWVENVRRSTGVTLLTCTLLLAACGDSSPDPAPVQGAIASGGSSSGGPLNSGEVTPTSDTTSFTKEIAFGGEQRQVLYIHPSSASQGNAPVLLLLTYPHGTPSDMNELTRAARIAADYGAWVIIPAPGWTGEWADNPADPLQTTDDVGFIATVISDAGSNYPVDTTRVYAAGYSNSAFMAERVICDRSDLIAGVALIGATERKVEVPQCKPSRPVPTVFFDGTDDLVVPYNGLLTILTSAQQAYDNWLGYNGCSSSANTTTSLPTTVKDGTSVHFTENQSCASGSAVALYTVTGGGHTWPGNQMGIIDRLYLGPTTQNIDATLALWQFFTQR